MRCTKIEEAFRDKHSRMNWKRIDEFEDYEVCDVGLVRSKKTNRILKSTPHSEGYPVYRLFIDGKCHWKLLHRILAEAFIPNPDNKRCVDHIDGDVTNNTIQNLRWVTHQENQFNRHVHKGEYRGVSFMKAKGKWRARIFINGKEKHLGLFDTAKEASECFEEHRANHYIIQ